MNFHTFIDNADGSTEVLFDKEAFFNDRCEKATNRKIMLIQVAKRLQEALKAGESLDRWNGFGEGYIHVREEIADISKLIMDSVYE